MTYKVYYSYFKQLMVVSAYGHILECAIKNVVEVPNWEHVHVQIQDQLMVEKNVMVIEWKRGYVIITSALVSVKLSLCKIRDFVSSVISHWCTEYNGNCSYISCVKNVWMWSFFWSVFSRICIFFTEWLSY